jgi:hypothetical protein
MIQNLGTNPVFSPEQEESITNHVQLAKLFHGLKLAQARRVALESNQT